MEKKINENGFFSCLFFVEVIYKPNKESLFIVRGGSPQMPETLFVGTEKEFCEYIRSLHVD